MNDKASRDRWRNVIATCDEFRDIMIDLLVESGSVTRTEPEKPSKDSQACPMVAVGDRVRVEQFLPIDGGVTERKTVLVMALYYNQDIQGTCRNIKKLQLLFCSDGNYYNPGNFLTTVDCAKCPLDEKVGGETERPSILNEHWEMEDGMPVYSMSGNNVDIEDWPDAIGSLPDMARMLKMVKDTFYGTYSVAFSGEQWCLIKDALKKAGIE